MSDAGQREDGRTEARWRREEAEGWTETCSETDREKTARSSEGEAKMQRRHSEYDSRLMNRQITGRQRDDRRVSAREVAGGGCEEAEAGGVSERVGNPRLICVSGWLSGFESLPHKIQH